MMRIDDYWRIWIEDPAWWYAVGWKAVVVVAHGECVGSCCCCSRVEKDGRQVGSRMEGARAIFLITLTVGWVSEVRLVSLVEDAVSKSVW